MTLEDLYRLLRTGHVEAQGIVDTMSGPLIVLDKNLCLTTANNAFLSEFKVQRDDVIGTNFFELGNGQWDIPELRELIHKVVPNAMAVVGYQVRHDFPDIGQRTFLVDARRLAHPDNNSTRMLVSFEDVTERQRADAEKDFILSETRHRIKNLASVIRTIVMQTETGALSASAYRDRLIGRIEAALRGQDIAARSDSPDFDTLVRESVSGAFPGRVHYSGPSLRIAATNATTMTMIFHEMATNSAKYGALSVPDGVVRVQWQREGDAFLICEWKERDGPKVTKSSHKGYGTQLIHGAADFLGGSVQLQFEPEGLSATLKLPCLALGE